MKKKLRIGRIIIFIVAVILVSCLCFYLITKVFKTASLVITGGNMYAASTSLEVPLYDIEYKEVLKVVRGTKIKTSKEIIKNAEKEYYKITYDKKDYLILKDNLVKDIKESVLEKEMFVRTSLTFYNNSDDITIKGLIKKGEKLEILDYNKMEKDGSVNMYKVKYNNEEGYVYGKYLVNNHETSLVNYDEEGNYQIHKKREDTLMAGSAADLDYYPYPKPKFKDNVMPSDARTLYLNGGVIGNIDAYIALAKESGINAFVVDIKDNTVPSYPAKAMEKYSPTNFAKALNSYEDYKAGIKKLKDAGFYVIGRITTFKDSFYAKDHPEDTIKNAGSNTPFNHDGSYWPSAYKRRVWEYTVSLAVESVKEMGFNEIQFDYVRFPDRTGRLEEQGAIDFGNTYKETKAQAIQGFVMYATDELHKVNAYVSIDVFGEAAHTYVTSYGQYWPAISNIADVISGMPYPDHFSSHEYGFTETVWTIPYKLLNLWGESFVMKRQAEIPTPAIVRTWIQAYDTGKNPATDYDAYMVGQEIKGLYDAGLTGGFMTWNSGSSLNKYKELSSAFGKEY
ncbi:MAG: putative glycoside hydrolase [Bacilli bacterium]